MSTAAPRVPSLHCLHRAKSPQTTPTRDRAAATTAGSIYPFSLPCKESYSFTSNLRLDNAVSRRFASHHFASPRLRPLSPSLARRSASAIATAAGAEPSQSLRRAVQDVNSHDSERSTDPTRTRFFCCFFARFPPPQGPFHLLCPSAAHVRLLPLVVARSGLSSVRMRVGCRLSTIVCTQLIAVASRQLPLLLTDCPTDAEGGTHPSSRMQANRSRYCSFTSVSLTLASQSPQSVVSPPPPIAHLPSKSSSVSAVDNPTALSPRVASVSTVVHPDSSPWHSYPG